MLRNSAFASLPAHSATTRALAQATFAGRFADEKSRSHHGGWFWRHRRPIVVIGWFGPLFWPYAYWDLFDYTFWPYAYDAFWPYAYDDLYVGLFGPYSYEGVGYSAGGSSARPGPVRRRAAGAEVCSEQVPALTDWPIEQIAQTVEPDATQQGLLTEFKDATAKALGGLQAACPSDLPSTPIGRVAAMRTRVEAMLQALDTVQPALHQFYDSLNDEQKARFNLITPEPRSARAGHTDSSASDVDQACGEEAARPTDMTTTQIRRTLHLTDPQRSALDALNDAMVKAADFLKANCPADEALTPPGRVGAMQQRLKVVLEAIGIVQPALDGFYGTLSDEQKARFNQLGARQG